MKKKLPKDIQDLKTKTKAMEKLIRKLVRLRKREKKEQLTRCSCKRKVCK